MGLDVYLYKLSSGTTVEYSDDGECLNAETIEIASAKYPDHYFKIGYWRSSYNDGGINSVLRRLLNTDLYVIANKEGDEYESVPDWNQTKLNALKTIEDLNAFRSINGDIGITEISNPLTYDAEIKSYREALDAFILEHKKDLTYDYSNRLGYFYREPMQVLGLIHGKSRYLDCPCVYVIYKQDNMYDWYVQALEIVIETCDYVLAQKDYDKYVLGWSG